MTIKENISKIENWNLVHAIIMIAAALGTLLCSDLRYILAFSTFSIFSFVFQNRSTLQQLSPFGGYANWVTAIRFLLLFVLTLFWSRIPYYICGLGWIVFVCLDVLDGWLARKNEQSTTFGQYFDMELDALFVLIMCCHYYLFDNVGIWILVPGVLRYFFKIGIELFPKRNFREKKKRYASTIAGIFFFLLLAAIFVEDSSKSYGLAFGSILICFSFGISAIEYIQFNDTPQTSKA